MIIHPVPWADAIEDEIDRAGGASRSGENVEGGGLPFTVYGDVHHPLAGRRDFVSANFRRAW